MEQLFNQLEYWKNNSFSTDEDILKIYNHIIKVKISNGNISILNNHKNSGCDKIKLICDFLKDVALQNTNLNTIMYINYCDNDRNNENIEIFNTGNNKYDNNFRWGVNINNPDVIRIINSNKLFSKLPIFTFTKDIDSNNLLFPHSWLLRSRSKNIHLKDEINFNDKKDEIIFRATNVVADISLPSRFLIAEYSYNNNEILNGGLGKKTMHPGHNNYVVHKTFLKLYKNLGILNEETNLDNFYEYFNINKFDINYPLNYRYVYISHSFNHIQIYKSDCLLIRYQDDKYKDLITYEDLFLKHNYNTFNATLNKLKDLKNNLNGIDCSNIIENRHKTYDKFFEYKNLVKTYGDFLVDYSNLFKF